MFWLFALVLAALGVVGFMAMRLGRIRQRVAALVALCGQERRLARRLVCAESSLRRLRAFPAAPARG